MNTTISISKELRDKIKTLGDAGDTYEDVIERLYESARINLLRAWLYDADSIPVDDALKEAIKKWPK